MSVGTIDRFAERVSSWRDGVADWSIALAVGATLLVSFALLAFALPVADDFCRAALDREWLGYVVEMYRTWTGRWAAAALYVAVLPQVNLTSSFYPLFLALVYFLFGAACYAGLRALFRDSVSSRSVVAAVLVLVALYWTGMPDPGETIYWLSGAVEYTLPLLLSVLAVSALTAARGAWLTVAACVATVLVTGLHEIAAVALTFVLAVGAASAFKLRAASRHRWAVALVCGVVGTAVNTLAPGNSARLEEFSGANPHDVITAARLMVVQVTSYLVPWLVDPKLLAASVVLVTSPWFRAATPAWARADIRYWRLVIPATWLLTIGGLFFAVAWGVGALGPSRLYNLVYGLFLLGWLATLFVWSRDLADTSGRALDTRLSLVASLVLAVALVTAATTARGVGDFLGAQNVMRFKTEMHARYAAIQNARAGGTRNVVLDVAPRIPESYFQRDIGEDAQHWRNQCVASYFGVNEIRLSSSPAQ